MFQSERSHDRPHRGGLQWRPAGGVKALLLVNEQLEAELAQLYAATGVAAERGDQRLH